MCVGGKGLHTFKKTLCRFYVGRFGLVTGSTDLWILTASIKSCSHSLPDLTDLFFSDPSLTFPSLAICRTLPESPLILSAYWPQKSRANTKSSHFYMLHSSLSRSQTLRSQASCHIILQESAWSHLSAWSCSLLPRNIWFQTLIVCLLAVFPCLSSEFKKGNGPTSPDPGRACSSGTAENRC